MNIFSESINKGKISNEEDLKRLFWKLSIKYHPDTAKNPDSEKHFIRLKNDYDEARSLLPVKENMQRETKVLQYNRRECLKVFTELISSNFPLEKEVKNSNKLYKIRYRIFSSYLSLSSSENHDLLDRVESELYQIKNNRMHNCTYGIVKFLLYNISSYHHFFSNFTYQAVLKNYSQIQESLEKEKLSGINQLLKWLIEDMAKGSALI